jgi:hypothetical protein
MSEQIQLNSHQIMASVDDGAGTTYNTAMLHQKKKKKKKNHK